MEKSSREQRRLMNYRIGDSVEVQSNEEGIRGSYYVAKVLDVAKSHVLVEYKTLLTDDESRWLRETVHVSEVRPRPPQLPVSDFHLCDEVDAYDNDGWWVGRITSVAESKYYACFNSNRKDSDETPQKRRLIDESKYYVYFSSTGDLVAYPSSRLRLHQELKNGKWVPSRSCM